MTYGETKVLTGVAAVIAVCTRTGRFEVPQASSPAQSTADRLSAIDAANAKRARKAAKRLRDAAAAERTAKHAELEAYWQKVHDDAGGDP